MSKRKPDESENSVPKRPRTEKTLKFVSLHEREETRKYIAKVKKGEEREILEDFNKEEYLSTVDVKTDKNGHFESLQNDSCCFKHVLNPEGKKTGKKDNDRSVRKMTDL